MGNGPLVCCMTQEERIFQIITEDDNNYKTIKRTRIHNPIEISFDLEQCILVQKYIRRFIAKLRFNQSARDLQRIIKQKLLGYKVKQSNSFINSHKAEQIQREYLSHNKTTELFTISKKPCKYSIILPLVNYYKDEYYQGSWNLNCAYYGYGTLYKGDNKYEGYFINGKLNGICYAIYSDSQIIYKGEWEDNYPHGKGEEVYTDPNCEFKSFSGYYLNGKKSYGKLLWKDDSYFQGGLNQNNKFNGIGTRYWADVNEKYEGEWYDGNIHGKGKYFYRNGSVYDGQFYMNKRQGYGTYTWSNSKYYEGEWKDNVMNGKGSYCKEGIVIHGIWKKGKLDSEGISLGIDEEML